jgi:FixJ family two-component response regulator
LTAAACALALHRELLQIGGKALEIGRRGFACQRTRERRIVTQGYRLGRGSAVAQIRCAQPGIVLGSLGDASVKHAAEVVYLVDDDASVREAIADLLEAVAVKVISFDSAAGFLRHERLDSAGCLVLDLQLPEMSGLDLQERLGHESSLPIIFITGRGDIPSSVRAMKAGAIEFLTKPVDRESLLAAVHMAFVRDRENRKRQAELSALQTRFSLLSPREREVLPLVVAGFLNKESAAMLGITEVTLQIHRGQIMRKMAAATFADLVRMCAAIGIPDTANKKSSKDMLADHPAATSRRRTDGAE